jgi:uncharacterized protein YbjT (DUF2867 family)
MPQLIVLTCASGRQCSALIPRLYAEPHTYTLRLVVNSQSSLDRLSNQYPQAEVVRADFRVPDDCGRVLQGASTIFYVGPPFHPYEVTFGMNMIDAAVAESKHGVFQHFIFSSAIHPEASKMLHHAQKRQIEGYLTESGLAYTVLQPSTFMDNFLGQLLDQARTSPEGTGTFMAPFTPTVKMSFSCVKDHAEIAAKIIAERERHFYATYQVVSTLPMSLYEYVDQASRALDGKKFEIKKIPFEQASQAFVKMTWGDESVGQEYKDAPERMLLYYNSRGLLGNPGVAEWLLGRKTTTVGALAREKWKGSNNA